MERDLIYVIIRGTERLRICDHVAINAKEVTEHEFNKGQHEYLIIECSVCKKEVIVGILTNGEV